MDKSGYHILSPLLGKFASSVAPGGTDPCEVDAPDLFPGSITQKANQLQQSTTPTAPGAANLANWGTLTS